MGSRNQLISTVWIGCYVINENRFKLEPDF